MGWGVDRVICIEIHRPWLAVVECAGGLASAYEGHFCCHDCHELDVGVEG